MKTPAFISAGWHGQESLGEAFWVNFVLGQVAIGLALIIVLGPIVYFIAGLRPLVIVLSQSTYMAYLVWASVGVWRSANTARSSSMSFLARSLSVTYTALLFVGCIQQAVDAT